MQAEDTQVTSKQRARGNRTCSQVHKITAVVHEGVQVALRMLGDVPVVEAGHMLLYLLFYHTLQGHTAQARVARVYARTLEKLQEPDAHRAGHNPAAGPGASC